MTNNPKNNYLFPPYDEKECCIQMHLSIIQVKSTSFQYVLKSYGQFLSNVSCWTISRLLMLVMVSNYFKTTTPEQTRVSFISYFKCQSVYHSKFGFLLSGDCCIRTYLSSIHVKYIWFIRYGSLFQMCLTRWAIKGQVLNDFISNHLGK